MHSNSDSRPIGKCKGCPLNLKRRCAVFEHPHKQWSRGRCKGYMNGQIVARYLDEQARPHEKTARDIRREKAVERKTIPHQDGLLNPGGSRW